MLVTVTLNPVLDRLYTVHGFALDGVFRASSVTLSAGGKGVNVARAWTVLGGDAVATGLLGGRTGAAIAELLAAETIDSRFLPVAGEARLALSIFDPAAGTEAVVNEIGPDIAEAEFAPFLGHLETLLPGADYLAISGSAPPGVPVSVYPAMIEIAHRLGIKCAVDVSGEALVESVKARPSLVKPNRIEAEALGVTIDEWGDAPAAARDIRERFGIETVVITGGPDGAVCASAAGAWSVNSPRIEIVSTLGSGDSLLAGFLWGLATTGDTLDALRTGAACGAANALSAGAGRFSLTDMAEIWGKIAGEKLA